MTDSAELFKKLARDRQSQNSQLPSSQSKLDLTEEVSEIRKKRGRPATGKRSDPEWIGRTYYIRKATDYDVKDELLKFKREGQELDKSELVDALLTAWVKWQKGENIDFCIGEISPIQKN